MIQESQGHFLLHQYKLWNILENYLYINNYYFTFKITNLLYLFVF